MLNFFRQLIDWLYIKRCYFCKRVKNNLCICEECYDNISFLPSSSNKFIENCATYSACLYQDIPKKLIHLLKYKHKKELALYQAKLMFEYFQTIPDLNKNFCIVPVPCHTKRKKQRGYNHMDLVAQEFCKLTNYDFNLELIKRIKNTKPQFNLSINQREENLKNAFCVDKTKYNQENLLIIDDVITTGSTIKAAIKELKRNNIEKITVLTFCTTSY